MIDWATASPALLALFTGLAFDTKPQWFNGRWYGRAQKYISQAAKTDLTIRVRNIQDIGEDETDQVNIGTEGEPVDVYAQLGNRRVIIEVRVESHQNTDAMWCWSTIERIRTRLRRPSSLQALEVINWALVETGPSIALPMTVRGAEWSAASMDVTFGARFMDVETEPFDWIERIEITSELEGVDGQQLPDPALNYTEKLIGP